MMHHLEPKSSALMDEIFFQIDISSFHFRALLGMLGYAHQKLHGQTVVTISV